MPAPLPDEIYLDNNASTRPLPEVQEAMTHAMGAGFGNPSSPHGSGVRARQLLVQARDQVAGLVGCAPEAVTFTSSGTEANNWAIESALGAEPAGKRLLTTPIEHPSVLRMAEHLSSIGVEVAYLPVTQSGRVELPALRQELARGADLVSVQWVNQETGTMQPMAEIVAECQRAGVTLHSDAAQAFGKLTLTEASLPDYLTCTAHKIHGPQGVGALIRKGDVEVRPLFYGGAQEGGQRPGTENLPGIAGFGKAAEQRTARFADVGAELEHLRNRFEGRLLAEVEGVEVNGDTEHRAPNTTNLLFREVEGQALMARLDQEGIRCSQSSACSTGRPEPSYVLRALGLSEDESYASVRFSFSELNTEQEVDAAVDTIAEIVEKLRAFARMGA